MAIARRKAGYRTRLTGLVTCYGRRGGEALPPASNFLPMQMAAVFSSPLGGEDAPKSCFGAGEGGQSLPRTVPPHPSRHATCVSSAAPRAQDRGAKPSPHGERGKNALGFSALRCAQVARSAVAQKGCAQVARSAVAQKRLRSSSAERGSAKKGCAQVARSAVAQKRLHSSSAERGSAKKRGRPTAVAG